MSIRYRLSVSCVFMLAFAHVSSAHALSLTSSTIDNNGLLPITYSCDGESVSPPVSWSELPSGTQSLAIIMDHEPGPGDLHWYWTVFNISPDVMEFKAGESMGVLGSNEVNQLNEYAPPCSKGPGIKTYTIHLYALSQELDMDQLQSSSNNIVTAATLREAMTDLVLESATLTFNFERTGSHDNTKPEPPKNGQPAKPEPGESRPPRKDDTELKAPTVEDSISSEACNAVQASVLDAGFEDVTVTCDDTYAYVQSDTYPDHDLMNGITGTNEQIPVPTDHYAAPIRLQPEFAETVTSIDAALGVAVNGIPIYDYSAQGELDLNNYDPKQDTLLLGQLDNCGGHSGRGDDYHYHAKPTCMIEAIPNVDDSTILGWGYDGFPIFGDNNPDGSNIAESTLDVCNGQADETFGYRYHTSVEAPYIVQCLVGEVDTTVLPRVAPLSGSTIRADLRPPREGVENLEHSVLEDGTRRLSYDYQGIEYYTQYTPIESSSTDSSCFDFEQKTISNGGIVETGTFCR